MTKIFTSISTDGVEILSKDGCTYCEHAVNLCKDYNLEYIKTMVDKTELKARCGTQASTYPQILVNDILVGDFFEFQEFLEESEPMLLPTLSRFTVFPIEHEIYGLCIKRPKCQIGPPKR